MSHTERIVETQIFFLFIGEKGVLLPPQLPLFVAINSVFISFNLSQTDFSLLFIIIQNYTNLLFKIKRKLLKL